MSFDFCVLQPYYSYQSLLQNLPSLGKSDKFQSLEIMIIFITVSRCVYWIKKVGFSYRCVVSAKWNWIMLNIHRFTLNNVKLCTHIIRSLMIILENCLGMVSIIYFLSALQIYSGFDSYYLFTATIIFIYLRK